MWTYVTTALPFFIMNQPWQYTYSLFFVNRFTLIFPICILFDLRDKEYDRQTGVKSLVTLLPSQKIKIVFNLFIILNILTALLTAYFSDLGIVDNFILLIPIILTFSLYNSAIKTKNDYLFYFILDGLMALSPILYFIKLTLAVQYLRGI
jgi:4-hydroxybenzoate polyprenyltransferase